jgi:hypothetical protein
LFEALPGQSGPSRPHRESWSGSNMNIRLQANLIPNGRPSL